MRDLDACAIQLRLLPASLRALLDRLGESRCAHLEELRLREGQAPAVVEAGFEHVPACFREHCVTERELSWVLEAAGQGSVHTLLEQLRGGFLAVDGGHRIGICGSVLLRGDEIVNFRRISSLSLRFAHARIGLASPLLPELLEDGVLQSTLIFSPPGGGKTTLLRDLIRALSDGVGLRALRVGVADERGELCGLYEGRAQHAVGSRTDIIDGAPKAQALLMLLRGMNPQVLAADEITAPEDVRAALEVAGCGVSLLATAHGSAPQELYLRPVYRALLKAAVFRRFIWIQMEEGERRYRVLRGEELLH